MLTISASQIDALENAVFRRFQWRLIPHVREHFPLHADYLGDHGTLRVIEQACTRAETFGFETERDLCLFTDLSIMLGAGFDSDPQLPWAKACLNGTSPVVPAKRMDVLWDSAMGYLETVLGPECIFPVRPFSLDRRQRSMAVLLNGSKGSAAISDHFYTIWPQKVDYLGVPALNVLIQNSLQLARHYRLPEHEGGYEFAVNAFLFGHRFYADPLYPWVNDILHSNAAQAGQERIGQLTSAFNRRFG